MSTIDNLRNAAELRTKLRRPDHELVPRALVRAMIALMLAVTGLVVFAQMTDRPNVGVLHEAEIARERTVILTGDRSGVYVATDADGNRIAVSSEDKAGFIGVIGRVFDRERLSQGIAGEQTVRVVRRVNGNVAVIDDATGLVVELIGYGADNVAAFARMVDQDQ